MMSPMSPFLSTFLPAVLGSIIASSLQTYLQKRWGIWRSFFIVFGSFALLLIVIVLICS